MGKEVVVSAKTIEQALELGAKELGVEKEDLIPEVLELPKKGFLGIGATGYKVKITAKMSNSDAVVEFLEKIIGHMKINAAPKVIEETKDEIKIDIVGENLGALIGYHGEILDSLQYLAYLAVNKGDGEESQGEDPESEAVDRKAKHDVVKITLDIENYRKKREEILQSLAKKMAERALKYGKPVTLEPMNPYERRIIHATVQEIEGVVTHSIGQENERRIVISKEGAGFSPRPPFAQNKTQGRAKPPYAPYGKGIKK